MRSAFPCVVLIAALGAAPAFAGPSGWVDPPAKEAAKSESGPADPTSKPQEKAEAVETAPAPRHAETPARRPKAAEVRRDRRLSGRAARPDSAPDTLGLAQTDRTIAARKFTADYLRNVSAPGSAMIDATPRFYGERVRFQGRVMSRSALMAEKSRFARRWPERRYAPRDGMQTNCDGAVCTVHTVFDFRAENRVRDALSVGVAELTLTVDFASERPQILSESSRVLRYGGQVVGAVVQPGRGV